MSKCYVFAYGTLLDPLLRFSILGYPTTIIESSITGFRLHDIVLSGERYPMLIEDPQQQRNIQGGYFEINATDIEKLDFYESTAYCRKLIITAGGIKAWIYHG